jgi:hypothetical protein
MSELSKIPDGPRTSVVWAIERAAAFQQYRLELIRVYGYERGWYEHDCKRRQTERNDLAASLREIKALCVANGINLSRCRAELRKAVR